MVNFRAFLRAKYENKNKKSYFIYLFLKNKVRRLGYEQVQQVDSGTGTTYIWGHK